MPLRRKLLVSFFGVASLILLIGIAGIIISLQVAGAFGTVLTSRAPALASLLNASGAAGIIRESAYKYTFQVTNLGGGDAEDIALIATNKSVLREALDAYFSVIPDRAIYTQLIDDSEALYAEVDELIRLVDTSADSALVNDQFNTIEAAQTAFDTTLVNELGRQSTTTTEEIGTAGSNALVGAVIYVIIMVTGVIVAVALGVIVSRQIVNRVRQLQTVTEKMIGGDYAERSHMTTGDEIGQLGSAFDTMAEAIQKRDEALNTVNQSLEKRVDERTTELRAATREAQEASRLKDEFLSIMSHELRTPLNAIIGFQGILLMSGKLDERGTHMVKRAQDNADRLLSLINNILDVSRIESGRMQLVNTPLSPAVLLDNLQTQMSVLADEKRLDFSIQLDPSVPTTIAFDEDALTKIITNLLANAIKFTQQGKVALRMYAVQNNLLIEVEDTGAGIPSHLHQVIFERFRQVDGSSKRAHGGSGLGLAIVQKLALAMGGTVQVRSAVSEGSTFTVTLPMEAVVDGYEVAS